jgi:hypothetical protein
VFAVGFVGGGVGGGGGGRRRPPRFDQGMEPWTAMWIASTTVFSGSHWADCALSCWQRVLNLGGGQDSSPMRVVVGVPLGSILAPVLCSLYVDDAPTVP